MKSLAAALVLPPSLCRVLDREVALWIVQPAARAASLRVHSFLLRAKTNDISFRSPAVSSAEEC